MMSFYKSIMEKIERHERRHGTDINGTVILNYGEIKTLLRNFDRLDSEARKTYEKERKVNFPKKQNPEERKAGDVWKIGDEWFGFSLVGESGPWNNKQAADAAARGMFKTAQQHNVRNYR